MQGDSAEGTVKEERTADRTSNFTRDTYQVPTRGLLERGDLILRGEDDEDFGCHVDEFNWIRFSSVQFN